MAGRKWTSARPIIAIAGCATCLLLVVYGASPYIALWRVGVALRSHDVSSLRAEIDWSGVRGGLKAELGGAPSPAPKAVVSVRAARATTPADDDLPEFGESFAKTAVSNVVDQDCDAEHVGAMLASDAAKSESAISRIRRTVAWAFFTGPDSFQALLRVGDDPREAPLRVRMMFSAAHGWRVTNVWLPQQMLSQQDANAT